MAPPRPDAGLEILLCPPDEHGTALGVLYHGAPALLRPYLVSQARAEAGRGDLDLSGLWIARRHGRIVGALLSQPLSGRAAAVWAPEVVPCWGRSALAAALVRTALQSYRARGFQIAQALVDTSAPGRAGADLTRGGMPRITELVYLGRDTATPLAIPADAPPLLWQTFGPDTQAEFRRVLEATYLGSLDMPELEGTRSLDDVLASHRGAGRFDPERWRLGRVPGEPDAAALVLLAASADRNVWEIAYLGLTPPARGRGLGRAALADALERARPHAERIELAVDTRNRPAAHLYRAAGFAAFDRRDVHLARLG